MNKAALCASASLVGLFVQALPARPHWPSPPRAGSWRIDGMAPYGAVVGGANEVRVGFSQRGGKLQCQEVGGLSHVRLANARGSEVLILSRGSEALILSRDREGAVARN